MLCDFSDDLKCQRCGYVARRLPTYRECRTLDELAEHIAKVTTPPWVPVPNPMIGDRVAALLSRLGVTKERVQRLTGVKDCGCQGRQQGLNHASGVVAKKVESAINAAVSAIIGDREEPGRVEMVRASLQASPDTNHGLKSRG